MRENHVDDDGGLNWEAVGREALAREIRVSSEATYASLLDFADALESGEDLTAEDRREVAAEAERLLYTLGSIGAVPWSGTRDPSKRSLRELLGEDAVEGRDVEDLLGGEDA